MTSPNNINNTELLETQIKKMGFRSLEGDGLSDFLQTARKNKWSHRQVISEFVKMELQEREHRSLQWRMRDSKIQNFKPIADYDWNWPKRIDRAQIEKLVDADFVTNAENVVLVGTPGLGKTMIAKNIIHNAVYKGHTALFISSAEMLTDLSKQDSARLLEKRIRHYCKPGMLCIDEIGYLSYDQQAADFLYQIISRRYEQKSTVITTNLVFSDWPTVFPGASSVASLIDRLIHHSEISLIEGESYREKEAKKKKAQRQKNRGKK